MNSSGHVFWGPGFFGAATFLYNNDVFQIQNDGNIVHCVRKKDTNEVVAHWAPGTDSQFAQPVAIPPNTPVVEVPNPWVIAIHPVPGATTVVNKTDIPVAARDKNKVVSIPPAGTICIPNTEQTALHLAFYRYDDLRAKDGTTPRNDNQNSDDATRAVPPGAVVEITSSAKLALA
jgi:hypothetical protein